MEKKLFRMTITIVYEADPESYGTDDAGEMIDIDMDSFYGDSASLYEFIDLEGYDIDIKEME